MNNVKEIRANIITELLQLDREGKEVKANGGRGMIKISMAISKLLRHIKHEFGPYVMVIMYKEASEAVGHSIGPFDTELLVDIVNWTVIAKIHSVKERY